MKLRGNCPAKVDEKGRLKIPAVFLEALKEYGNQFYITSTTGEAARIYPMKVWSGIEDKLAGVSSQNRAKRKFLMRTDRKSTRLNSSHLVISYAVFCLKKKKTTLTAAAMLSTTFT